MNKIYTNELSLHGQYDSWEQFLNQNEEFIKTLRWIRSNRETCEVYKKTDLYHALVTQDEKLYDIRGKRFQLESNDKARLLKNLLLSLQSDPPFWDDGEVLQDGAYCLNGTDVSGTSIAEAAAGREALLSFYSSEYMDKELKVIHNQELIEIPSVFSSAYLSRLLYKNGEIDINEYVKRYYANTRLNFSNMELEYGMQHLEKWEIEECLRCFDRFVSYKTWNEIYKDNSLVYKAYSPSEKEKDWFRDSAYKNIKIDKFRCVNPKRCFGYRDGDKFVVLRIERDHKISDNG